MEDQRPATDDLQLCRWMNANNSSTRNLPNEVLSFIFELVCAPTKAEDLPKRPRITLASVCSHWHDVVWNTPQLWRTLSIEVRRNHLHKAASTLQMFADNHGAPQFISLKFTLFEDYAEELFSFSEDIEELLPPLEAFLSQAALRIRCICLCDLAPKCLAIVALINERCSNIEGLYLSQGFMSTRSRQEFKVPTYWSTVTTLQLYSIPLDIWFDFLSGCPRLVQLACDELQKPTNGLAQPQSHQVRPMRFPHLEYLSLDTGDIHGQQAWVDTFLEFYHFPSLKTLRWFIYPSSYSLELFHRFLFALPQCCSTIHFVVLSLSLENNDGQMSQEQLMEAAVAHVGKIRNLVLSCSDLPPLASMSRMLSDSTFLPSLARFQYCRISRRFDEIQMNNIDKLFQSRKAAGAKSFRFDVPGWGFEFANWEDQRAKLSRLMDGGSFEVQIYCGGKKLDI